MKEVIIIGFVLFIFSVVSIAGINASSINSEAFKISNCIRGCTEFKKMDQRDCTTNYLINLNNCSFNYKTCLKQIKETKDRKVCLTVFNECKKITRTDKVVCAKNIAIDFFNCKDMCLNPQFKCAKEGESILVILSPPFCCEGLKLILPREENILGISGICTAKCGNSLCDIMESAYNCPIDCF